MENERRKQEAEEHVAASRPDTPGEEDDHFTSPLSPTRTIPLGEREAEMRKDLLERSDELRSFNHDVDWEQENNPNLRANRRLTQDHRVTGNEVHRQDVDGEGHDRMAATDEAGLGVGRDTALVKGAREVLVASLDAEGHTSLQTPQKPGEEARLPSYVAKREAPNPPMPPKPPLERFNSEQLGLPMLSQLPELPLADDTDIGGPALTRPSSRGSAGHPHHPLASELRRPLVDRDCMTDPVHDAFILDTWHAVAENNTKIYRTVFRCMPDNLVRDWHDYHQYVAYEQRFNQLQGNDITDDNAVHHRERSDSTTHSGPPGAGSHLPGAQIKALSKVPSDIEKRGKEAREKLRSAIRGEDLVDLEKEAAQLRTWADELNQAQEARVGKPLQRLETQEDEKAGLQTVPEDEGMQVHDFGGTATRQSTRSDSNTVRNSNVASSPTTSVPPINPLSEKAGSPTIPNDNFAGYSDSLNHNSGPAANASTSGDGEEAEESDDERQ